MPKCLRSRAKRVRERARSRRTGVASARPASAAPPSALRPSPPDRKRSPAAPSSPPSRSDRRRGNARLRRSRLSSPPAAPARFEHRDVVDKPARAACVRQRREQLANDRRIRRRTFGARLCALRASDASPRAHASSVALTKPGSGPSKKDLRDLDVFVDHHRHRDVACAAPTQPRPRAESRARPHRGAPAASLCSDAARWRGRTSPGARPLSRPIL